MIEYHPGRANIVADALSRKHVTTAAVMAATVDHLTEMMKMGLQLNTDYSGALIVEFRVRPTLEKEIKAQQRFDEVLGREV